MQPEDETTTARGLEPSPEDEREDVLERGGRWEELVAALITRAESAHEPWQRAQCLVRAALTYETKLDDRDRAFLILQTAFQEDLASEEVARELARLTTALNRWPALLADCRALLSQLPDDRQRVALLMAMARFQERNLRDLAAAEQLLSAAVAVDPEEIGALRGLAGLYARRGDWGRTAQHLVRAAGASKNAIEKVRLHMEAASIYRVNLDDAEQAIAQYRRVLEIAPGNAIATDALAALERPAVEEPAAPEEPPEPEEEVDPFFRLVEQARRLRDEGGDAAKALQSFEQALALRPDDYGILHEVLDLLSAGKHWKRALQVLESLAGLETGKARSRYLVAMGNILNYELRAADEAVEMYNRVLDEDPDDLKTFERIDKLLTAKRAWRDEARSYRRMIKRLGASPPPEKRPTLLMLWKGLAEIYRSRLKDLTAAAAAYEVCAQLAPDDPSSHEILAEIYEHQGPPAAAQAAEKRQLLLERSPTREDAGRQLRALLKLYAERQENDKVWCVCAALVACGIAEAPEQAFYQQHAARPFAMPTSGLSEEMWQRAVYHAREDRRLSQIFAIVSPSVALVRAKEARALGLDERRRADPATDPTLASRLVAYAAGLFGQSLPAVYLHPEQAGEIDLANAIELGRLAPALVLGGDLLRAPGEREMAFSIAQKLALLRLDHIVLWPSVVPSLAELRVAVLAVLKMFQPGLSVPEEGQPAFRQYAALLQKTLQPHVYEPLMAVAPSLAAEIGALDLAGWAVAAHHTANRAGLLVCGDLAAAARRLSDQARVHGGAPDQAIKDLVRWSVSPEHFALREQLGLAITA